jgi:phenylpropionate dioxygenase-like ring-hydroxylating dioxygenase large terminal subunit
VRPGSSRDQGAEIVSLEEHVLALDPQSAEAQSWLAATLAGRKNDYFPTYMGRQPIFIARNRDGELNAFVNACSHRGAMLCRFKRGSRVIFTCPFPGWTFTNSGKLLKVKNPEGAGYPECFNKDGSHDLTKIARFESYRGFLFGSLNPDVVPLVEHLDEAAKMIDLITVCSSLKKLFRRASPSKWDQQFESAFLQRRVRKLSVPA